MDLLFEPDDDDPLVGTIFLRIGEMRNFHGPVFSKRTHVYVKAYLLQGGQPTKDSKRSTEMVPRAEDIDFNKEAFSWSVEPQQAPKYEILVGIWGHSKLGLRNIPIGEVSTEHQTTPKMATRSPTHFHSFNRFASTCKMLAEKGTTCLKILNCG